MARFKVYFDRTHTYVVHVEAADASAAEALVNRQTPQIVGDAEETGDIEYIGCCEIENEDEDYG